MVSTEQKILICPFMQYAKMTSLLTMPKVKDTPTKQHPLDADVHSKYASIRKHTNLSLEPSHWWVTQFAHWYSWHYMQDQECRSQHGN
jgi:hypothetical protein